MNVTAGGEAPTVRGSLALVGGVFTFLLSVQKQRVYDHAVPKAFINVLWKPMCSFSYVFREETVPTHLGVSCLGSLTGRLSFLSSLRVERACHFSSLSPRH